MEALSRIDWDSPTPLSVHMPSGLVDLTRGIYQLTETTEILSPLARQLLHLACHSESQEGIARAREHRGVLLDRWWWSAVAYGWYGAGLKEWLAEDVFFGMIDAVWGSVEPNVIFLFLDPFEEDALNSDTVSSGYRSLKSSSEEDVVVVPRANVAETTDWILSRLLSQGLIDE